MANYKSILFEQMIKDFAETEVKPLWLTTNQFCLNR